MSPTHLKMKVWERGAGPTLACGTGACALTVAAILAGKTSERTVSSFQFDFQCPPTTAPPPPPY